jgi:hypothetical protein
LDAGGKNRPFPIEIRIVIVDPETIDPAYIKSTTKLRTLEDVET